MPEERKLVTILFADVTGSTVLGDALDPEDVRTLMRQYYAHARRIIPAHSGTLEKFIGDAVMAVFGLPQVHGDDAERALAAALALRDAVTTDELLAGRLVLRIGINTGEVVATDDPSEGEFLVTGDAVNVAARLQQSASTGEIVASERTATLTRTLFLFEEGHSVQVKGKPHPLRLYPLKGRRATRQIDHPPLIDRQHDLQHLSLVQARVIQEQRPHVISLVAPAGTGKTRLLDEFLAHLNGRSEFRVARAQCLPYGQVLTSWPLRDLLADLIGVELTQTEQVYQGVVDTFVQGGHLLEEAVRRADRVLTTLGIDRESSTNRESMSAVWQVLIEACARQKPCIIIFEDLQWASDSLLDLVEQLMRPRMPVPLLLLIISRPELLDRRPTWGGGCRCFTALTLEPLSQSQTRELVAQLAPGVHEVICDRIVERSGGNPFFVLELLRGLLQDRRAEDVISSEELPDTVHQAMLARLDLLSRVERSVVQVAAVAGRSFRPTMVQALLDSVEPAEIEAALERLLAQEFLVPAGPGLLTLRHSVMGEVACRTLARSERTRLHAQIAAWLEEEAAERLDEFAQLIASHYCEAVRLSRHAAVPIELPFERMHAVSILERAGILASRSCAFAETRTYLQCAIDLAPQQEHLRLYECLGDAVTWGDVAIEAYRRALTCWRATEEQEPLVGARLLRKLLITHLRWWDASVRPRQEELASWVSEAQRLAEATNDEHEQWWMRVTQIWWQLWLARHHPLPPDELEQARAVALAAAAYFEQRSDWLAFSEALDSYTALSHRTGALQDMLEASRRRLNAPGLPMTERGDALNLLVGAYLYLGDYHHCVMQMREALTQLLPGDSKVHLASGVVAALQALYLSGQWSDIKDFVPVLEELWSQTQHDPGLATRIAEGYMTLLDVALARADHTVADRAAWVLERCLPAGDMNARWLLAAYRADDPGQVTIDASSDDWLVPILAFLNEQGVCAPPTLLGRVRAWPWASEAVRRYVAIAEALEHGDGTLLATILDEVEAHGLIPHTARVRVILAQWTRDRAQLDRARPLLKRLGDRRFLRRLEDMEATWSTDASRHEEVNHV